MQLVTISSKRQITIPKRMLSSIGMRPKDKLLIDDVGDILVIKGISKSVVDQTAGSLTKYIPASKRNKSFAKIMRETKKAAAKKLAKNL